VNEVPSYRFVVTLDPADAYLPGEQAALVPVVAEGGFQEVTGLGAELEVQAYPEGGANDAVRQLPVRHSWGRITLKRGLVRDQALWKWYQAGLTQSLGARRSGSIILLTMDGQPSCTWAFRGGLAVKWNGPTFNAMQAEVAVESLEIAHEGLSLERNFSDEPAG
jgi:phage tail-like protein